MGQGSLDTRDDVHEYLQIKGIHTRIAIDVAIAGAAGGAENIVNEDLKIQDIDGAVTVNVITRLRLRYSKGQTKRGKE
jgi:hypothetical protein